MQARLRLPGARARALVALFVALVFAGAARTAGAGPVPRVLPDLVPQSPYSVIGPTTGFSLGFGVDALLVDGCYPEERVRKGAARCLRFDTIVGNVGEGAFELAYAFEKGRGIAAIQRVYKSDGTFGDRYAVRTELHPTHAHFHVQDFYVSRLWNAGPDGERVGDAPVARGDKNGFCPQDSEPVGGGEPDGRAHYSCFTPDEPDQRGFQVVGISAGWQDVYGAELPDQFVEITGVPDGQYVLEIELDPHDVFVEADNANNRVCVLVSLKGRAAEIVEPTVPC